MPTNLKRMTILLTDEMEEQLDVLKKEFYYADSRSEMFRNLLSIGLREKMRELGARQDSLEGTQRSGASGQDGCQ